MAEQRYQAVLAVISDGLSISQVAQKVGVSRQTLHSWVAQYEVGYRRTVQCVMVTPSLVSSRQCCGPDVGPAVAVHHVAEN